MRLIDADELISNIKKIVEICIEKDNRNEYEFRRIMNNVIHIIDDYPSGKQWIPCSERLPKAYEKILAIDTYGEMLVCELSYTKDWYVYGNEYLYFDRINAWMPLPEKYKGDDENGKMD